VYWRHKGCAACRDFTRRRKRVHDINRKTQEAGKGSIWRYLLRIWLLVSCAGPAQGRSEGNVYQRDVLRIIIFSQFCTLSGWGLKIYRQTLSMKKCWSGVRVTVALVMMQLVIILLDTGFMKPLKFRQLIPNADFIRSYNRDCLRKDRAAKLLRILSGSWHVYRCFDWAGVTGCTPLLVWVKRICISGGWINGKIAITIHS